MEFKISHIWIGYFMIFGLVSCQEESVDFPPEQEEVVTTAAFEYTGVTDVEGKLQSPPVTVIFNNQSTDADTYLWTFGDGASSTTASPEHTYNENGVYKVILLATGPDQSDTATTSFRIGIPQFDVSLAMVTDPGVTEFTVSYELESSTAPENSVARFYLQLSLSADFDELVAFVNDQSIEPVTEEELLEPIGSFKFRDRMPDTTYYARIRQVVTLDGKEYEALYSNPVVAQMQVAPLPVLTVEANENYQVGMSVIASITPPEGERFLQTGGNVNLVFSYAEDFSETFVPQIMNTGSFTDGVFHYWAYPGTTVYVKGSYDLNGREVVSEPISYTIAEDFLAYFTRFGLLSGIGAHYSKGTNILQVGPNSGKRFLFLLPSFTEVVVGEIPLEVNDDKIFFYDDESLEYTLNDSEFNEGIALQIYRVEDDFLYGRIVYQSDASNVPSMFFQESVSNSRVILVGFAFKAEIRN